MWVSGIGSQRELMDYMVMDRGARERMLDLNVLRGAVGVMFDHFLVEESVKDGGGFR